MQNIDELGILRLLGSDGEEATYGPLTLTFYPDGVRIGGIPGVTDASLPHETNTRSHLSVTREIIELAEIVDVGKTDPREQGPSRVLDPADAEDPDVVARATKLMQEHRDEWSEFANAGASVGNAPPTWDEATPAERTAALAEARNTVDVEIDL